jgi:hypothetical protein
MTELVNYLEAIYIISKAMAPVEPDMTVTRNSYEDN